jgi:hypothetical protein
MCCQWWWLWWWGAGESGGGCDGGGRERVVVAVVVGGDKSLTVEIREDVGSSEHPDSVVFKVRSKRLHIVVLLKSRAASVARTVRDCRRGSVSTQCVRLQKRDGVAADEHNNTQTTKRWATHVHISCPRLAINHHGSTSRLRDSVGNAKHCGFGWMFSSAQHGENRLRLSDISPNTLNLEYVRL